MSIIRMQEPMLPTHRQEHYRYDNIPRSWKLTRRNVDSCPESPHKILPKECCYSLSIWKDHVRAAFSPSNIFPLMPQQQQTFSDAPYRRFSNSRVGYPKQWKKYDQVEIASAQEINDCEDYYYYPQQNTIENNPHIKDIENIASESAIFYESEQNEILMMLRRCHCQHEMLMHCGLSYVQEFYEAFKTNNTINDANIDIEKENSEDDGVIIKIEIDGKASSEASDDQIVFWNPEADYYKSDTTSLNVCYQDSYENIPLKVNDTIDQKKYMPADQEIFSYTEEPMYSNYVSNDWFASSTSSLMYGDPWGTKYYSYQNPDFSRSTTEYPQDITCLTFN